MPLKICCPQGHKFLLKDDLAGKRIACPTCRSPIDVPAAAQVHVAAAVPVEPEPLVAEVIAEPPVVAVGKVLEDPKKSAVKKLAKAKKKREKERMERNALRIVSAGFLLLALGPIVYVGMSVVGVFIAFRLGIPLGSPVLLSYVVDLVGLGLLLAVPARAGARGLLIACMVCCASRFIPLILQFMGVVTTMSGFGAAAWSTGAMIMLLMSPLLWMTEQLLLFAYIQRVADFIGTEAHNEHIQRLMVWTIVLPLATAGWIFPGGYLMFSGLGALVWAMGFLVIGGCWLIYVIYYVLMMFTMRNDLG